MEVTRHGIPHQTVGDIPTVGDKAPEFTVKTDTEELFSLSDLRGHYTLINVVPDINTPICSRSTKLFNESVIVFPDTKFITVSTNTVDEQKHWCAIEDVTQMRMMSDVDQFFGQAYGVYLPDMGTDARSVWILNPEGQIVYRELVLEQTSEPDYSAALSFLDRTQAE